MNELVVCLLRTNFYCTETAPHKHRIFYYRRPVWSRIHKLQMHQMLSKTMLRTLPNVRVHNAPPLELTALFDSRMRRVKY